MHMRVALEPLDYSQTLQNSQTRPPRPRSPFHLQKRGSRGLGAPLNLRERKRERERKKERERERERKRQREKEKERERERERETQVLRANTTYTRA